MCGYPLLQLAFSETDDWKEILVQLCHCDETVYFGAETHRQVEACTMELIGITAALAKEFSEVIFLLHDRVCR